MFFARRISRLIPRPGHLPPKIGRKTGNRGKLKVPGKLEKCFLRKLPAQQPVNQSFLTVLFFRICEKLIASSGSGAVFSHLPWNNEANSICCQEHGFFEGGPEKKIVELANRLCEKGFKIALLVFDRKDERGTRIKDLSPQVQVIAPPFYRNHPIISLRRGTYETVKAVRQWKPDVVYSNLWNTNPFVAVVGELFGAKVILEESSSVAYQIRHKKHRTLSRLLGVIMI